MTIIRLYRIPYYGFPSISYSDRRVYPASGKRTALINLSRGLQREVAQCDCWVTSSKKLSIDRPTFGCIRCSPGRGSQKRIGTSPRLETGAGIARRWREGLLNGVVRSVEDWAKPSFHRAGYDPSLMHLAAHRNARSQIEGPGQVCAWARI
jgi:hypothetical protein